MVSGHFFSKSAVGTQNLKLVMILEICRLLKKLILTQELKIAIYSYITQVDVAFAVVLVD